MKKTILGQKEEVRMEASAAGRGTIYIIENKSFSESIVGYSESW